MLQERQKEQGKESGSDGQVEKHWTCFCFVTSVCCSVLQCVAVCCSVLLDLLLFHDVGVLQCVAVCCSVLQCVAGLASVS